MVLFIAIKKMNRRFLLLPKIYHEFVFIRGPGLINRHGCLSLAPLIGAQLVPYKKRHIKQFVLKTFYHISQIF